MSADTEAVKARRKPSGPQEEPSPAKTASTPSHTHPLAAERKRSGARSWLRLLLTARSSSRL